MKFSENLLLLLCLFYHPWIYTSLGLQVIFFTFFCWIHLFCFLGTSSRTLTPQEAFEGLVSIPHQTEPTVISIQMDAIIAVSSPRFSPVFCFQRHACVWCVWPRSCLRAVGVVVQRYSARKQGPGQLCRRAKQSKSKRADATVGGGKKSSVAGNGRPANVAERGNRKCYAFSPKCTRFLEKRKKIAKKMRLIDL